MQPLSADIQAQIRPCFGGNRVRTSIDRLNDKASSDARTLARFMPFIVSALGGFLFGYDNGGIAGSLLFIRHDFALSGFATGIVVSSLILGAVLSAGIAGKLLTSMGRVGC